MSHDFSPPIEAKIVTVATIDMVRERRARLQFVLARELLRCAPPGFPRESSHAVVLARDLVDDLLALVAQEQPEPATLARIAAMVTPFDRAALRLGFRRALETALHPRGYTMIVAAWTNILIACHDAG